MSEGETGQQRKYFGIALVIICLLSMNIGVVSCFVVLFYIIESGYQEVPALAWMMVLVILPAGIAGAAKGLGIVTQ